jgi:hypothetical protein
MPYVNPIWLEGRRRYWQRHDAHRFRRPDGSEYKSYATRLIEQRQIEEEEARIAAEQEEMRETLSWLRRELAEVKFALAMRRIAHKYDPNQPRVPAGDSAGGQWTNDKDSTGDAPVVFAQAGFGRLVAEIPVPGGRRCVYNFGVISVAMPGAANFRCSSRMHWSGATHGTLLNDN